MLKWKSCVFLVVGFFTLTESYSKYGRTCKDIGCLSNEQCVMETTPCSYYQKDNECGSYPTCKRLTNSAAPSCSTFVCPPTQVCTMEGSRPRCVEDRSKVGRVGYDTGSVQNPTSSQNNQGGSNLYPSIPRSGGETTPRPSAPQPSYPNGPGYQGGQIGSGYPGQTRPGGNTYPQQPSYPGGYNPQQGGGYPQQGYNNRGGYPQQGYNGYPQQGYNGYPQQGYNNYQGQGYQGQPQGGYNPYGGYQNNRYGPQNSGASPSGGILDKITETLKSYGLFYMTVAYLYQRICGSL